MITNDVHPLPHYSELRDYVTEWQNSQDNIGVKAVLLSQYSINFNVRLYNTLLWDLIINTLDKMLTHKLCIPSDGPYADFTDLRANIEKIITALLPQSKYSELQKNDILYAQKLAEQFYMFGPKQMFAVAEEQVPDQIVKLIPSDISSINLLTSETFREWRERIPQGTPINELIRNFVSFFSLEPKIFEGTNSRQQFWEESYNLLKR